MSRNLYRSVCDIFCKFTLKLLTKMLIAFTGYHRQDINIEYTITQYILILSLAIFVYAKTHTTAYFLAFLYFTTGIFQCANLKYIWIIPTFFQGRVRENKAYRFFKTQQPFLVFHNQIVCTYFIISLFFF